MNAPMAASVVKTLDAASAARWDAYVDAHPDATFFHRAGWARVIAGAFGHATHYVYAERGGRIAGVLPLTHQKSALFSNGLVSNAFCVLGGPLCDDEDIRRLLDQHAIALMHRCDAEFLEYRSREISRPDWQHKSDLYVRFRRPIEDSAEANLKAIPRKQRAVVRKAIKAGQLVDGFDDGIDRLHHVYALSVRNLGTPVFPKRYFRLLRQEFGEACQVLMIGERGGADVAGVLSFVYRGEILPYYGGGTAEARRFGANDFLYWRVMERAREQGLTSFDFGRSKVGTGSFAFKKNWGFQPEPLVYEFLTRDGGAMPDVNPLNPKYRMIIAAWKRLPLPLANTIGPWIVRGLG